MSYVAKKRSSGRIGVKVQTNVENESEEGGKGKRKRRGASYVEKKRSSGGIALKVKTNVEIENEEGGKKTRKRRGKRPVKKVEKDVLVKNPTTASILATPLLTKDEEVTLSRQVQKLMRWEAILVALEREPPWDEWAIACGYDLNYFRRAVSACREKEAKLTQWETKLLKLKAALLDSRRDATMEEWAATCGFTAEDFEQELEYATKARLSLEAWETTLADIQSGSENDFGIKALGRKATMAEWAEACGVNEAYFGKALREARAAKDRLVLANMRLVVSMARRFRYNNILEMSDLIQEGVTGLMKSINKFDPGKGYRFSTYATYWIRSTLQRACDEKATMIRVPSYMRARIQNYKKALAVLNEKLGRKPSDEDVCEYMSIKPNQLARIRTTMKNQQIKSSDQMKEDWGRELRFTRGPLDITDGRYDIIYDALSELPEDEAQMVRMRYGLGYDEMKPSEISMYLGIDRNKVSLSVARGLRKLRAKANLGRLGSSESWFQE